MVNAIKKQSGGFTLAEAMIVLALVAIISAIAIPVWQSMKRNSDLKSAAYEIMAAIQWAKSEAARRNICIGLQFNPPAPNLCPPGQGDCYELFRDDAEPAGVACDHALTGAERALIGTAENKILRAGGFGTKAKINTTYPQNAIAVTPRGLLRAGGLANGHIALRAVAGSDNCYNLTLSPTAGLRLNANRWNGADCPTP
jgi:prepilin-type N-terminal cleavage/methylation domain-containing protein